MAKREKAADNRLVGLENSIPHGAVDTGLPRVVDVTATTVTPEPEWTHAPRDGVDGTHENLAVLDKYGNPHWATEGEVDEINADWKRRGFEYRRYLESLTIDARAFLDGRVPDGYVAGDRLPNNCYASHPDSHFQADFASHQLCNCGIDYFRMGYAVAPAPLLERAS